MVQKMSVYEKAGRRLVNGEGRQRAECLAGRPVAKFNWQSPCVDDTLRALAGLTEVPRQQRMRRAEDGSGGICGGEDSEVVDTYRVGSLNEPAKVAVFGHASERIELSPKVRIDCARRR